MNVSKKASNCDRRTAVSGYFSSLITAHSALFTSFPPFSQPSGSSPTAVSRAYSQKQIPSSNLDEAMNAVPELNGKKIGASVIHVKRAVNSSISKKKH
jgi:hypothetical protein